MIYQRWITKAPWIATFERMVHPQRLRKGVPSLIVWGAAAGLFAGNIVEYTPLFRKEVFSKLPIVGGYWQAKLEKAARVD